MFVVPLRAPGLEVIPLRLVTGATGFCQEFFDNVVVPAADVIGDVNDGWNVASRLLVHERNAIAGGSEFHDMDAGGARADGAELGGHRVDLAELARTRGLAADSHSRQLVAEAHVLATVNRQLSSRLQTATNLGVLPPAAGSLLKLFGSTAHVRTSDITMELAGSSAVVVAGRRPIRGARGRLPVPPGHVDPQRHQRDPAQHHQRAGARASPRAGSRP